MSMYLLKIFKEEKYLNDFLNGKLYMNTLKYFKEDERLDIARLDRCETIVENFKPNYLQIETFVVPKDELCMMTKVTKKYDLCNIFCMLSIWKEYEEEKISLDEKNKEFGNYCIVITNFTEFLKRIDNATNLKNIEKSDYSKIDYIDKNKKNKIKENMIPFTKFDNFSYQREFRIAINTKRNVNKPFILDIGDLRDIAVATTYDKIEIINNNYYQY
ncbi:hypothetical protein ALC152_20620 [Arcobacter sp. 15-2]|uniref:hypothetical protein n=1 Tax=Arcobacter sp. 15-2 TaxID=3374109 RepID=UPI00399C4D36